MDVTVLPFAVVALLTIGVVIYVANQDEFNRIRYAQSGMTDPDAGQRSTLLRWLLYGIAALSFMIGLLILQMAFLSAAGTALPADVKLPPIDARAALGNFVLSLAFTWFSVRVVASQPLRERLERWIGTRGRYSSQSSVHTSAVVLALALLALTVAQLILSGGLSGLAQNVEAEGVSPEALVFQGILMIAASFLGVGLAIRRSAAQSLERLGLRLPTPQDVVQGVGVGLLLYFALIVMASLWALLVPAEQIQQQSAAADQIARAFGTLPLALLLSATSAISEEILFRGALQPIFGLGLTSIFFALVHMQYALTPATLIIFVVALGLGWLRQRQSTSSAIIAHFVYNFIQLAAVILVAGAVGP